MIVAFFLCLTPAARAERVKVGVSLPLSGPLAIYGSDLRKAIIFANKHYAHERYDFLFEDDRCEGKAAVSVAQKLVSVDHIRYVLGFGCSSALLSAAPIYEKNKVLVIASLPSSPAVSDAGDYIFRTVFSDAITGRYLEEVIFRKHRIVGVVSEETDYCEGMLKAVSSRGRLTLDIERIPPNAIDTRSILLKLKSKSPEALLLNMQSEEPLAGIVRQIAAIKWQITLYGAYFPGSPSFLKAVGSLAEGIIFVGIPSVEELLPPAGRLIYSAFIREHGAPLGVDYSFVAAYNSVVALDGALQSAMEAKEALYSLSFKGLSGPFSFDQNGDLLGFAPVVKIIKGGVPTPYIHSEQTTGRPAPGSLLEAPGQYSCERFGAGAPFAKHTFKEGDGSCANLL